MKYLGQENTIFLKRFFDKNFNRNLNFSVLLTLSLVKIETLDKKELDDVINTYVNSFIAEMSNKLNTNSISKEALSRFFKGTYAQFIKDCLQNEIHEFESELETTVTEVINRTKTKVALENLIIEILSRFHFIYAVLRKYIDFDLKDTLIVMSTFISFFSDILHMNADQIKEVINEAEKISARKKF